MPGTVCITAENIGSELHPKPIFTHPGVSIDRFNVNIWSINIIPDGSEGKWFGVMNNLITLPLQAAGVVLAADFIAGFIHWLEDAYVREDTPIIGKWIGRPNTIFEKCVSTDRYKNQSHDGNEIRSYESW